MITRIYLKENPKERIDYPNCYPILNIVQNSQDWLIIQDYKTNLSNAHYILDIISRVEFKP